MAAISLKLPEDLLEASGRYADALCLTRAAYIRRALEQMNRETRARLRARRLRDASRKVRGESMRVNAEFAAIEKDVDALGQPAGEELANLGPSVVHRHRHHPELAGVARRELALLGVVVWVCVG